MRYMLKGLRSNSWTTYTGVAHLALFVLFAGLSLADSRTVDGVDNWFKPMKFALSIGVFALTLSLLTPILLEWAREDKRRLRRVRLSSAVISLMLWGEILFIGGQAARGVASHFNIYTALDGAIYSAMGLMILTSTVMTGLFAAPFFLESPDSLRLKPLLLSGIRWGFVLFFLGSIAGGVMSSMLTHSVGDAGLARIPFLGWSLTAGDIRLVHLAGLHGIQVLPVLALLLSTRVALGRLLMAAYIGLFIGTVAITTVGISIARLISV
ncbi:MAG: hypothetical protein KDK33_10020 [Leptospiraceae bacterium]|nr:hypothetical protein [Leptospiraceae bacterium]